ncbi:hypothetical protein [Streptoalloteichus hindustanus]|uniref:Uncharacterized protein n=1 Tax=Streptoalloteichus hindustanus TaxID=2017 RepID=A0A1M5D438_STRHI|nr:hypothetical protein [Streptoalloteichus hindustanus]SHF61605.1 hypothetical protein SAMN05444320_104287 [Streptoalloteichus hindustanus]
MAVHTAQASEAAAKAWWERLPAESPLAPADYRGRAALIVCSDALAEAVAALLDERGVRAVVDQVRVDPVVPSGEVMALAASWSGQDVVVPVLPGQPALRLYPRPAPRTPIEAEAVATITVSGKAVGKGGWVAASALADALHALLSDSPAGSPADA